MSLPFSPAPISFEDALATVSREIYRRGLAATHRIAALHSWPDATAEGASFAASVLPSAAAASKRKARGRWKFLVERDGRVSVRSLREPSLHEQST